jgi:hypothetical protein
MIEADTTSTPFQLLPGPNDLLLLPKAIEPAAEVSLMDGMVTIATESQQLHVDYFRKFPNLNPVIDSDGRVVLRPIMPFPIGIVLVSWPQGDQIGLLLWPSVYYSTISAEAVTEMVAAGIPVVAWQASRNDDLTSVLAKNY